MSMTVTVRPDGSLDVLERATVDLRLAHEIGVGGTIRQAFRTEQVADGFPVWILPTWSEPMATIDGAPLPLTVERRHRALRISGRSEQQPGTHLVDLRYRVTGATHQSAEGWVVPVTPLTQPDRLIVTGPGIVGVVCLDGRPCGTRTDEGWTVEDPPAARVNGQAEPDSRSGLGHPWGGQVRVRVRADALDRVPDPALDPR